MKPVSESEIRGLTPDSGASGASGARTTGSRDVHAVFLATRKSSTDPADRPDMPGKDLISLPGTQALLSTLARHNVATGTVRLAPGDAASTGRLLAAQIGRAGCSVATSAVITDCPDMADAASIAGLAIVVLAAPATSQANSEQVQASAAGIRLVVRDPAELDWTDEHGLHVKTLDSLPRIDGPPLALPAPLAASRPLLFLDYDGTLTPIVDDPARAFLPESVRSTIAELGRVTTVTIVSGRDLKLLRRMVDIDHLWYAGSHGFEIVGPEGSGITHISGAEFSADLDAAEQDLNRLLLDFPGHLLERKRMTIAVHYRNMAASQAMRLQAQVDELIAGFPTLHVGHGKMVMEVRPAIEWNKGEAVAWILSQLPESDRDALPVYIGDDLTDEDAFRRLAGRGLGIAVCHDETRATAADHAVGDTDAVHALLERLLTAI
jgi:alpha,alpha-trehalase